jgi:LmbE family N-acetylglucosaminyl deacetylase/SAM-dependent methyltransferase
VTAQFTHDQRSRAPAHWDELIARLPRQPVPGAGERLIVVAAHPDDETLGAGGLIATAARAGAEVIVVVASDGEASHPSSPSHSPAELARRRSGEVRSAVRELATNAELVLLHLPDGALNAHTRAITAALDAIGDAALVVAPWWGDGHPDHAACARAAAAAHAANEGFWQYPIWAWHWGAPLDAVPLGAIALDSQVLSAKQRALACHVSQHEPLSDQPGDDAILTAGLLAHFTRGVEVFVTLAATQPAYFDALYRTTDDPWGLLDRGYEQRKRDLILASLPRRHFQRAFEPGCATGALTAALARRCTEVVAADVSDHAVKRTSRSVPGNVHVSQLAVPRDWPDGRFDLIVLSEVGYYCPDLAALVARVAETLTHDGVLVACHWRHPAPDHPHTAADVHTALGADLFHLVAHVEPDFLLDLWTRDPRSVAQAEGILA